MSDCSAIDALMTAYVDNHLEPAAREQVRHHLRVCPPCQARAAAEQAVQRLLSEQRDALSTCRAPGTLHTRCGTLARGGRRAGSPPVRVAMLALAATLVLAAAVGILYRLTASSPRIMAAELTADHLKCFAMNRILGTRQTAEIVEASLASGFGWQTRLPAAPDREGLTLVGSRPCVYGEGRVAHVMYRHHGRPVSLFMLPRNRGENEVLDILGHEAAIWSSGNRTFVLIARETRPEVQRLVAFVKASIR